MCRAAIMLIFENLKYAFCRQFNCEHSVEFYEYIADDVTMSHRYEIIGICNKLPFLQNVYF